MDGFERREKQEESARQREEAAPSRQQHYRVVEDRGWGPETGAYGARVVVIAPVGGSGYPPEVHDVLELTGKKHDARQELGKSSPLAEADVRASPS